MTDFKAVFAAMLLLGVSCAVHAQQPGLVYEKRTEIIHGNIYTFFHDSSTHLFRETSDKTVDDKPYSYLWPLCALIQATNELEVLDPAEHYMEPVIGAIDQYYGTKPPCAAYEAYVVKAGGDDRFYDDNEWIAIAYMDAYNRKKEKRFLEKSEEIYRFVMSGYDTVAGGGLYWKEGDKTTKNTCSNGPGILLALQLFRATGEKKYLDTALLLYNWTNSRLLSPEGIYYDALKLPGLTVDKRAYTYNAGTMLQSNVLLFSITGNKQYLKEAKRLAEASLLYFYKQGRFPGNYWFNAVLMRGYVELYKFDKDKKYLQAFIDDTEKIWQSEMDPRNLAGQGHAKKLLDQAGLLEIIARIAWLKKEGF